MRTFDEAHIFDHSKNGNLHHGSHVAGLVDDHGYKVLARCDENDAVKRNRLEDSERHVACSRRHVDKKNIQGAPVDLSPELLNKRIKNRTSPDYGSLLVLKEKIYAYYFNACGC